MAAAVEIPKILNAPKEWLMTAKAARLLKVAKQRRIVLANEKGT